MHDGSWSSPSSARVPRREMLWRSESARRRLNAWSVEAQRDTDRRRLPFGHAAGSPRPRRPFAFASAPTLTRPIRPAGSVNQMLPSGPAVIASGPKVMPPGKLVTFPFVLIRPIPTAVAFVLPCSANHKFPSHPAVIGYGPVAEKCFSVPAGLIRTTWSVQSVAHTLPSEPAVTPLLHPTAGNSVTTPLGVIRPIRFPKYSVNQRLPSGPATMSSGHPDPR